MKSNLIFIIFSSEKFLWWNEACLRAKAERICRQGMSQLLEQLQPQIGLRCGRTLVVIGSVKICVCKYAFERLT